LGFKMKKSLSDKRVLITYGPTWVAIDDMRVISNRSSGTLGKLIINDLLAAGAAITALEGPIPEPLKHSSIKIKKFVFFDDFKKIFNTELNRRYDIVIHAAAVSDFRPLQTINAKLPSDQPMALKLIPVKKLIQTVKRRSPGSILVGFKLESTACQRRLRQAAMKSIQINHCDLIVANSLKKGYLGFIFNKDGSLAGQGKSRKTISRQLINHLCRISG